MTYIYAILATLVFLPSVTFGLIGAEIFPWALLYFISRSIPRTNRPSIILTFFLLINGLVFSLYHQDVGDFFRSVGAYLNSLLIFTCIYTSRNEKLLLQLAAAARVVLYLLVIIGSLQYFSGSSILSQLVQIFVPRGSGNLLGEGRGITLLSTEPSRASYEILFIYILVKFVYIKNRYWKIFCDVIVSVFVLIFLRSAVGASVLLFYLLILYNFRFFFILSAFTGIAIIFGSINFDELRFIKVLASIIARLGDESLVNTVFSLSGFRLASIYSSVNGILYHPLGFGVGGWNLGSITSLSLSGLNPSDLSYFKYNCNSDWCGVRPTSPLAAMALDFGFFAFPFAIFIFWKLRYTFFYGIEANSAFLTFIFMFVFIAPLGNPIPWVTMAIIVRICKDPKIFTLKGGQT